MKAKYQVSIIGTGSLGTALAYLTKKNGHKIKAYEKNQKAKERFVQITNNDIKPSPSLKKCIENSDIIIPCLPSHALPEFYNQIQPQIKTNTKIISISKGLFPESQNTISQQLKKIISDKNFIVLSGPTFAQEIIDEYPTACIIASKHKPNKKIAIELLANKHFQIEYSSNVVTCEYNGILKNCYSVTMGIIDKLGYGMNTKSLAIVKITNEISQFYKIIKLQTKDIYSLSFLGDFVATGLNPNSRNFQAGQNLDTKKTDAEGINNIKTIIKIAKLNKAKLPILEQTSKIINKKTSPKSLVNHLL